MPLPPGSLGPFFRVVRKYMGPSWLVSTGQSGTVGYTLDLFKDAFVERLRLGLLARFPQNDPTGQTTAPDDALAALGRDRQIIRGINETAPHYAARLTQWLQAWRTAGNPFTLMDQLAGYCGPLPAFRTVDVKGDWFSRDAAGNYSVSLNAGNWDWDGDPLALNKWSRFWVIIYPNGLWFPTTWGDGHKWGEPGRTWGSTATSADVSTIRTIVAQWKPAGTTCVNIILAFDNTSFDPTQSRDGTGLPDGNWGGWSKITSSGYVPARLTTARYWDGV